MNLIPWRSKQSDGNGGGLATPPGLRSEIDSLFDRFFQDPMGMFDPLAGGGMRADLAESDEEVTVRAELPGVDPEDVEISVAGNTLTISGEKSQEREDKKRNYHYVERQFGSFRRSVPLPAYVDPDKVEATFRNGVLTVTVAKRPDAKPRRIQVKGA